MDLEKFSSQVDGFDFRNLRVAFDWKSAGSISFVLCHYPAENVRSIFGWLDVHETHADRRVKIRVCLPHHYLKFKDQNELVQVVCEQLALPTDSFSADFISPQKQLRIESQSSRFEAVSYGPPFEPDDNPWDDRDGVSPLETISRERAFGLLLKVYPEFHREVDSIERSEIMAALGGPFLSYRETASLADTIQASLLQKDHERLRQVFELIEKLVVYGDDYTRNGSLPRLFESLLENQTTAADLEAFMHAKTLARWKAKAAQVMK